MLLERQKKKGGHRTVQSTADRDFQNVRQSDMGNVRRDCAGLVHPQHVGGVNGNGEQRAEHTRR